MGKLGARVRELRQDLGWTLQDVARRVAKTAGYISRIEGRDEMPSAEFVCDLASALKVPPEELLRLAKEDLITRTKNEVAAKHEQALSLFRRSKR